MKKQIILRLLLVVAAYPVVIPVWIIWHTSTVSIGFLFAIGFYAYDGDWVFWETTSELCWSPIPHGLLYDLKHWGDA